MDQPVEVLREADVAAPKDAAADKGGVGRVREGGPAGERATPAFTRLATMYATEATPLSGLEATLLGALGATADDGTGLASDLELENPLAALALSRLAGPALAPLVPEQFTAGLAEVLRGAPPTEPPVAEPEPDRLARMEEAVADLRKKVGAQSRTITNLRRRLEGR
jgi:hypothetical protein